MLELKYKNWNEITINVYQKLQCLLKQESTGDSTMDNLNMNITLLSILCDVDEDVIADLSIEDFKALANQCVFINDMPKVRIKDRYTINGQIYNVQFNVQDMTMAQYIDYQTFLKDSEKYMKEIIACFLIPKGKKYGEGYKIADVIEDIGNYFSIVDALSVCFFFTILFQSLTKATLRCLVKKMKREKRKLNKVEQQQMDKAIAELTKVMNLVGNGFGFIG
jgi:hypothetical protein